MLCASTVRRSGYLHVTSPLSLAPSGIISPSPTCSVTSLAWPGLAEHDAAGSNNAQFQLSVVIYVQGSSVRSTNPPTLNLIIIIIIIILLLLSICRGTNKHTFPSSSFFPFLSIPFHSLHRFFDFCGPTSRRSSPPSELRISKGSIEELTRREVGMQRKRRPDLMRSDQGSMS